MTDAEVKAFHDRLDEAERLLSDCRTALNFRSSYIWLKNTLSNPIDAYFDKYCGEVNEQERRRSGAV